MKKRGISIIALLIGVATIFYANTASNVYAEGDTAKPPVWLQVSPTHRSINLDPGDKYDGEFTVTNIGSEDFAFKVYASPFSVVGEDYNHNYEAETSYNQIARWVTFDEKEFELAVDESQVVKFHVDVPEDVAGGSQHAVLFAESSGKADASAEGIKAVSRVGVRLSARIAGETRREGEVVEYSVPTFYATMGHPKITATSKVKNTGNTDFEARYNVKIDPFFGGESVFTENKSQLIYPDSELKYETVWEDTPLLGLFNVSYTVSAGDTVRDEKFVVLVIPIWFMILIIALLTFLIVWITLKVKKRRQLRSRIKA